ncbi:pyruvate kinase-like [Coccinella septempunctata]|uniref:pyruvate kinase-like n=1 Tax=Coccinella septempunctata TaxID=41139 RepID=UPI001D08C692|nr:pyruvate kinase-like [Coccinella septempunctata]
MAQRTAYCPKLPWMVDFYTSADGRIHNQQLKAAFARTYIDHLCHLNPESAAAKHRTTQMVFTIPENITVLAIEELLNCGMSMARIPLVISHEKCMEIINRLRHTCDRFSKKLGRLYPLAIALEFRGTEIRTGNLQNPEKKPIRLEKGKETKITTDPSFENLVTSELIYVDYQKISKLVRPGDQLLLDNGKVTLSALEVAEEMIKCIVNKTGDLHSNVSVTLVNAPVEVEPIGEEYMKNIEFALEMQVDAVIMTTIVDERNIKLLQEKLQDEEKKMLVIAKIGNTQAIENFDDIVKVADGIFVGSSELIGELPREKIFLVQKSIIARCNKIGKPVMCSFEVAEYGALSEAEITKIVSFIDDGVDCFVLTQCDVDNNLYYESIRQMNQICREGESAAHQRRIFSELTDNFVWSAEPIYSLAISVVESSFKCNAAAIVIVTRTGRCAKILSRFRPRCPIISVIKLEQNAKQLQIYRGIIPLVFISKYGSDWNAEVEARIQLGITFGKLSGFIRMGDIVIVVCGSKRSSGFTNTMKIVFASEFDVVKANEEGDH